MSRSRSARVSATRRALLLFSTLGVLGSGSCRMVGTGPAIPPTPVGAVGAGAGATADVVRDGPPPARRFGEVRALWVVRTTMTSPEAIQAMIEAAERGGINTLLVQVRGRGDAYYRSAVEPRAESLSTQPAEFDPLALVIREAHSRNIAVHAWTNTHVVTTLTDLSASPSHVVHQAPELLAVPRALASRLHDLDPEDPAYVAALLEWSRANRQRVEGLYTSPIREEVHDRLVRLWGELTDRYALDGIHLDYVRYPARDFDYSRGALAAFRRWAFGRVDPSRAAELDRMARSDPVAWADGLPDLWDDFRRERLTDLVARGYREIKRRRPDIVVSSAVVPDLEEAREHRFQDWALWLERGIVDVVVPMSYTPDDARFRSQVASAFAVAGERARLWAGVGVYQTTFDGTLAKIGIAREIGAGGVALFSYDWIRDEGGGLGDPSMFDGLGRDAFPSEPR